MVESMKEGSVVVDMAAEQGETLRCYKPQRFIALQRGVTIIGLTDLPWRMAHQTRINSITQIFCHLLTDDMEWS